MKKALLFLLMFCACFGLSACTRVGGTDSLDLLGELKQRNLAVTMDEFVSNAEDTVESGYIGTVRLSLVSDKNRKVERIVLTAANASDPDHRALAQTLTEIYCGV